MIDQNDAYMREYGDGMVAMFGNPEKDEWLVVPRAYDTTLMR